MLAKTVGWYHTNWITTIERMGYVRIQLTQNSNRHMQWKMEVDEQPAGFGCSPLPSCRRLVFSFSRYCPPKFSRPKSAGTLESRAWCFGLRQNIGIGSWTDPPWCDRSNWPTVRIWRVGNISCVFGWAECWTFFSRNSECEKSRNLRWIQNAFIQNQKITARNIRWDCEYLVNTVIGEEL